jgi:putative ABC transport system permease protein
MVVKTAGDPMQLAGAAKETVEGLGGRRPVYDVRPMSGYVSDGMAESRFLLLLLAVFAALAMVLCAIGLYGVVSHTTVQRTREMGIRMALGATRGDILRLIIGEGLGFALIGTAVGIAAALATTRALEAMLFGVTPADVPTLATVSVLLAAVSALACYVPAQRATRIDASVALGAE